MAVKPEKFLNESCYSSMLETSCKALQCNNRVTAMLMLWRDDINSVQFLFVYFLNSSASGQLQNEYKANSSKSQ
jgi:hypothetical protein